MHNSTPLRSFNSAFRRVESSSVTKVSTKPARVAKFPLVNNANEKMFWEEFRDSKKVVPKIPKSSISQKIPLTESSSNLIPILTPNPPVVIESAEEASAILSSPLAQYMEPSQSPLLLPPKILSIADSLVTSRHADKILNRVKLDTRDIESNPFLSSIAVHRLAKLVGAKKAALSLVSSTESFRDLLEIIEAQLASPLPPRALANIFWAVNQLGVYDTLGWADRLIDQLEQALSSLPLDTIPSILYTLVTLDKRTKNLQEMVIQIAVARRSELPITDMISIGTSLARLQKLEKAFMIDLSDRVINSINSVPINDLVSVLWSITSLKVTDTRLMSKLVHVIGTRVSECSLRNIVDIVWSISKSLGVIRTDNSDIDELFRFTIAPVIRGKMMDCSVRELSTILWSYSSAQVFDSDFFHDIVLALVPKVSLMNAHDISSVLWSLGCVNYSHSDLMSCLKHAALKQKSNFSPLQLSRVIYGLGACGVCDKQVFGQLASCALERSHLLYTQNLVEILIGLNGGKCLGDLGAPFLKLLQTDRISGRDAVQILSVIGENKSSISLVDHDQLIKTLVEIVKDRFNTSGRWIPSGFDLVDLVHAIGNLRLEDPDLIEPVLLHLSSVYKSPSFSNELFIRFLDGLSKLCTSPKSQRMVAKLCLLRTKGISAAMESLTERLGEKLHLISHIGKIQIIDWFATVCYCDENVAKLIASFLDHDIRVLRASVGTEALLTLCVAGAQLGVETDWIMTVLDSISIDSIESTDDLVKYIWAKLAMGEGPEHISQDVLDRLCEVETIVNLSRAHQVALSLISSPAHEWCKTIVGKKPWFLEFKQSSRKNKPDSKSLSKLIDKYTSLVSFSLNQLEIKHSVNPVVVLNVYTVSIAIPNAKEPNVLIDVLSPEDVVSPGGDKWTGTRVLKGIHLANTPMVTIPIRDIQAAIESNSLNPFIADKIAPFVSRAKNRVEFIDSKSDIVDDLFRK